MNMNRRGFLKGLLATTALVAVGVPKAPAPIEGRLGFYRNIRFHESTVIKPVGGYYVAMVHPENSWFIHRNGVGDYTIKWREQQDPGSWA